MADSSLAREHEVELLNHLRSNFRSRRLWANLRLRKGAGELLMRRKRRPPANAGVRVVRLSWELGNAEGFDRVERAIP